MKKGRLRFLVITLLLLQLILVLDIIYTINQFYSSILPNLDLVFSKPAIFLVLIIFFAISVVFVGIIYKKSGEKSLPLPEPITKQSVSEFREIKQKSEQDKKNLQAQNERKQQILGDLMRNLSVQLKLEEYANQVLINISKQIDVFQGIFFVKDSIDLVFKKAATYAYYSEEEIPVFKEGIGLTGQVASNKKLLNIENIPDRYITVLSGLGKSSPGNLIIFPVLHNESSIGIIELASFIKFDTFIELILIDFSLLIGQHVSEIIRVNETKENH
jgi:hypothetical protein